MAMIKGLHIRAALVTVLLCLGLLAVIDPAAAAEEPRCVRAFDGMYYIGKPSSAALGLERIRVQVSLQWWPDRRRAQDLPRTAEIGRWLRTVPDRTEPLVIDLEHWPQRGSGPQVGESARKQIELLRRVRSLGYRGPVGYYGVPPVRDYWRALQPEQSPAHQQWLRENELWAKLAGEVDVLFPSLYSFYDDSAGWERYAIANLSAARQLARRKPVWAFMWPQYHNSNRQLAYRYLPPQVWKRQLELVAAHADGIVIWGGASVDGKGTGSWDDTAPWWRATLAFLDGNRARCAQ